MAAPHVEEAGITRSKRHSLRRIALGLAVAALISPAAAQARPLDVDGLDARTIHRLSLPVRDAEELAFTRHPAKPKPATVNRSNGAKGFEAGVGSLVGLVLILAATGTAVAVHHGRKTKLSPA